MIIITLVCNLGMSTSLLVDKMLDEAKSQGIEVDIDAVPHDGIDKRLAKTDILLVGPQVRHWLNKFKDRYADQIPVIDVINISDYGLLNGKKVLNEALAKFEEYKNKGGSK